MAQSLHGCRATPLANPSSDWQQLTIMIRTVFITACAAMALPGTVSAQSCVEQSISWSKNGEQHRTVIEPRLRNGCAVLSQTISRHGVRTAQATGRDCDCDLIIDGEEARFSGPNPLAAGRMLNVCRDNLASASLPPEAPRSPAG